IFTDASLHYQAGDALYALPTYEDLYLEDQYARYLPEALLENRVFSVDEAQEYRRVWFISTFFLNDDVQTEFRALESSHRLWYVANESECSQAYCYIAQLMVAPPN